MIDQEALLPALKDVVTEDIEDTVIAVTYDNGESASIIAGGITYPDHLIGILQEAIEEVNDSRKVTH